MKEEYHILSSVLLYLRIKGHLREVSVSNIALRRYKQHGKRWIRMHQEKCYQLEKVFYEIFIDFKVSQVHLLGSKPCPT